MLPNFEYEKMHWEKGLVVAGADEVGRGAFAGPVVAAVVILGQGNRILPRIDDSKKLTIIQREESDVWIRNNSSWGIGEASVLEINKHGIVKATHKAFRRAINNLNYKINHLLIDAFYLPYTKGIPKHKQTPIVRGDSASVSIAAASIIAKVYRDKLMEKLSNEADYSKYLWHKNKGYGTKAHREQILKHGVTKQHRTRFRITP